MFIIRLSSMQLNLFANYWRNVFFRNLVLPRCFFFTYSWAANFINNSDSWKKCIIRRKNAVLISNFINILVWMCAVCWPTLFFIVPNRNFMFIWSILFLTLTHNFFPDAEWKLRVQRAKMGWMREKTWAKYSEPCCKSI